MIYNDFPVNHSCEWVASDTETYTYIDGIKVSDNELIELGSSKPLKWFRRHANVVAYAWIISDSNYTCICENFNEWAEKLCELKVKAVWFYNAKFDFSFIDYEVLSAKWHENHGKGQEYTFKSLHSDTGQRYSYKLWYPFKGKGKINDRHKRIHSFTCYDFCNIVAGGLKKCLESFNVTDECGIPIRKLEMDYQGDINEDSIKYMINDARGLYHLVRLFDRHIITESGYGIASSKPDIMTAGGLAKKILLRTLYRQGDDKRNKKMFQKFHPMTPEFDMFLRRHYLYRGGATILNPIYRNRFIDKEVFKYDINSSYPYEMSVMPDLVGSILKCSFKKWDEMKCKDKYQAIFNVTSMFGILRNDKIPIIFDNKIREYTAQPIWDNKTEVLFFDFELEEFKKWYELDYNIKEVYYILKKDNPKYKEFVINGYANKVRAKTIGDKVAEAFEKIKLNSAYGKFAERCERMKCHYELNEEGAVRKINDGFETDSKNILSVVIGSYITASARTNLFSKIREICGENVKKYFIYADTDSIITFKKYRYPDDKTLGAFKDESENYIYSKFLAPKTYILYNGLKQKWDIHCKGVPVRNVEKLFDNIPPEKMSENFTSGIQIPCLAGINIRGGKALIPIKKELCKESNLIGFSDITMKGQADYLMEV